MSKKVISITQIADAARAKEQAQDEFDSSELHMIGFIRLDFPKDVMYISKGCIAKVIFKKATNAVIVVDHNEVEYFTDTGLEEIVEQINLDDILDALEQNDPEEDPQEVINE